MRNFLISILKKCFILNLEKITHNNRDESNIILSSSLKAILILFLIGTVNNVISQSPGGVSTSLEFWLKSNAGITESAGAISAWADSSTNGNNSTGAPNSPSFITNGINFNPSVAFDGVSERFDFANFTSGMTVGEIYYLIRSDRPKTTSNGLATWGNNHWHHYTWGNQNIYDAFGSTTRQNWNPSIDITQANIYNIRAKTGNWTAWFNSKQDYNKASNVMQFGQAPHNLGFGNLTYYDGDIPEVIMYSQELLPLEKLRVNSYLALKYGITLDQTTPQNYIASDGTTTMWINDSDGYNSDIFGIGRDDNSGLDQRVSKSINTGSIITASLDADFTSANNAIGRTTVHTNDLQFLSIANNGGGTGTQTTEIDPIFYVDRVIREWKVDATNFTQPVNLKFAGYNQNYYLITSLDGDFSTDITRVGALSASGEITGVTLADGMYFTIAKLATTVEFNTATATDIENIGGNIPVLMVTGTVTNPTTVTVTDALTGTATAADHTFISPQVITIPVGVYDGTLATAISIPTLSIMDEAIVEGDETIDFTLDTPTGDATIGTVVTHTYTITNDDSVLVELSASSSDLEATGGNLPVLLVTGTVEATATTPITVNVNDAGTGTATTVTDYAFTSPETVTIPVGVYDGTPLTAIPLASLSIVEEAIIEGDETIDFTLDTPTGDATIGTVVTHTYTITNDDTVTVNLSASSSDLEATGGNLPVLLVTGTVEATVTTPITVNVNDPATGTATAITDYAFTSPETVTIPVGVYDGTPLTAIPLTTLSIVEEAIIEGDETIDFTLDTPTGAATIGTVVTHTYTITNDDTVTVNLSASSSDLEAVGGNLPMLLVTGTVEATVTTPITVNVNDAGTGTATTVTDYAFTSPETVTIPVGVYDGTPLTAIPLASLSIVEEGIIEGDETIDFTLDTPTGAATIGTVVTHTYTITNDDSVLVELSASSSDLEATGGNLPVLLVTGTVEATVTTPITVNVNDPATGTATAITDYAFTSPETVTIPVGVYDGTPLTAIPLTTLSIVEEAIIEGDETIDFTLDTPTGDATIGTVVTHTYTITNDDTVTVNLSASSSDLEAVGGNLPMLLVTGTVEATVTTPITVNVNDPATGTATAVTDYAFTSPETVTIPVGVYDGTPLTAIPLTTLSIVEEAIIEGDETIDFTLDTPTGAATIGTVVTHTYTITNDDTVTVNLSASSSDLEATGGNLPVLLVTGTVEATVTTPITVNVNDAGTGTATTVTDYAFTSPETVTIPVGVYDGTPLTAISLATLSIVEEAIVEGDETIDFTLDTPTGDATIGTVVTHTYTITNDDSVLVDLSASSSDIEATGGNLPVLLVTGTVTNPTTVNVNDAGTGTATTVTDYAFTSPETVTIPVGVYDGTPLTAISLATLSIVEEAIVEGDETIDFTLDTPTGDATIGTVVTHTYTITNDDSVLVDLSASSSDIEATGGNLPVLLVTGTVTNPTTVNVNDAGTGTATTVTDYAFTSPETVTIPVGVYDGTPLTAISLASLSIVEEAISRGR